MNEKRRNCQNEGGKEGELEGERGETAGGKAVFLSCFQAVLRVNLSIARWNKEGRKQERKGSGKLLCRGYRI